MTGLDKIINKIEEDSAKRCDEALEKANAKAELIAEAAEKLAAEQADKIIAEAKVRGERIVETSASGAEQLVRRAVLSARVEAINGTVEEALNAFHSLPESKYFEALLLIFENNIVPGRSEIRLGERDLNRLPADFEALLQAVCQRKNAEAVLNKTPAAIENGFLIICGDIEINCTAAALFEAQLDVIKEKINSIFL